MHLRLPIVALLVTGAAAFAGYRALTPHPAFVGTADAPSEHASPLRVAPRLRHANASVRVGVPASDGIVVYVAGAVIRPGLYTLRAGARAAEAVRLAGGPRPSADLVAVNLAAPLADGDEVAVYPVGASGTAARPRRYRTTATGQRRRRPHRMHGSRGPHKPRKPHSGAKRSHRGRAQADVVVPIDLNLADAATLATLPGVGPTLAERIVVVRETSGPFATLDDLLDVSGMTIGKIDGFARDVVFDGRQADHP